MQWRSESGYAASASASSPRAAYPLVNSALGCLQRPRLASTCHNSTHWSPREFSAMGRFAAGGNRVQRIDRRSQGVDLDQLQAIVVRGAGLVAVVRGHQEGRRARLLRRNHLVGDAADGADLAVAADRAGARHEL